MVKATIQTLYDLDATDSAGKPFPLRQFAGQPLLIVNTASLCGFSGQFRGLEAIWQQYRASGLVVLGVPSNDFGKQEPGNSLEIVKLCTAKFGITFPLLQKTVVRGKDSGALFQWLTTEGGFLSRPRWNFYKYVIGRDGHLQNWFSTAASPAGRPLRRALHKAIQK